MKVLLAEDGVAHAKLLTAVLSKAGYTVVHVENGKLALDLLILPNHSYDLLITDILMPEMNGHELVQELQRQNIQLPTIFLTAKQRDEDVLRGLTSGAADYILKPFSPAVVLARVANVLQAKKSAV